MHGWSWEWHCDHHGPHDNVLKKTDLFGIVFGSFAIFLFAVSSFA